MAGRKVTIPAQVTRVAADYPAVPAIVYMLGAGGKLVADNAQTAPAGSMFATVDPAMAGVSSPFSAAVTNVNIEQLLAARPQLVFLPPGNDQMIAQLQKVGIPSVVISAFTGPSDVEAGVSLIGSILGGPAPAKARAYASFYNGVLAKTAAATRSVPASARPGVLYTSSTSTITEGKGSIVTAWITEAGGVNVATSHGISGILKQVSLENILSWNPDYIVCLDPSVRTQILADPRWKAVTAVRDQHVYTGPQGVFPWVVRSAEAALQPLWTAEILHPALVSAAEVRQETTAFYSEFYSYHLTSTQLNQILGPAPS
jgi:iron complex transport system substrate-binding protein